MRLATFFWLLLLSQTAFATELWFGEATLNLGDDQERALELVRAKFNVQPVTNSPGEYLLQDQQASTGGGIAGMLYFQDGRLKWASRRLATFTGNSPSAEALTALNSALMRVTSEQGTTAQVKASITREFENDVERIVFEFPGKVVLLRKTTTKKQDVVVWLDEAFPR